MCGSSLNPFIAPPGAGLQLPGDTSELFRHLPQPPCGLLVCGRRDGLHLGRVAAHLAETARAVEPATLRTGIDRRVELAEGAHLGALSDEPVADLHQLLLQAGRPAA